MRGMMLVVAAAALGGCEALTGPSEYAAYVHTRDADGGGFRADRVVWYYAPDSDRYDGEHPAECINFGCTVWGVPAEASGDVYVAASWQRPIPRSAYCHYSAYNASPVTASRDDPPAVALRLEPHETCA